uniref:PPM-type phosphatase domain-containing protein n=1 Tax=Syphacia muris TaxID=451379 RepID=A0A0N5AME6_9BILA
MNLCCAIDGIAAADRSLISVCGWRKGEREDMQDAHFFDDHFALTKFFCFSKRSALYAIFDGHAGRKAADFAKEHLPAKLKEKFSVCTSVESIEKVLKRTYIDCFKQVDEEFLHEARRVKPSWKDGTTVTTILIVNNVLYCANIGDSRAVVCRSKGGDSVVALQLTVDHSPLQFDERMRIQKAGGNVKDGRIMGVLEVSRSIGDGQFKAHGVTCIPDVKKFSITSDDRFVLIACDGLWKTFNNKEAVEFVTKELKAAEKVNQPGSLRHLECERVADALAAEAVKRGCGDNVSAKELEVLNAK